MSEYLYDIITPWRGLRASGIGIWLGRLVYLSVLPADLAFVSGVADDDITLKVTVGILHPCPTAALSQREFEYWLIPWLADEYPDLPNVVNQLGSTGT